MTVKNPPVAPAKAIHPKDSHVKNPRLPILELLLDSFVDEPTEASGVIFFFAHLNLYDYAIGSFQGFHRRIPDF